MKILSVDNLLGGCELTLTGASNINYMINTIKFCCDYYYHYNYTYNEKYFSDNHFSYIVRVITWRA